MKILFKQLAELRAKIILEKIENLATEKNINFNGITDNKNKIDSLYNKIELTKFLLNSLN